MSKIFQLKYRNLDLSRDINERFVGLIRPGIMDGGDITVVPGQLRINVSPWKVFNRSGMVVRESSLIATLDVNVGQTNVVALKCVYVANGAPIADLEVIELGVFSGLPNQSDYIIFGYVVVPLAATEVLVEYIQLENRATIDKIDRKAFRGVLNSVTLLPERNNLPGDYYIVFNSVSDIVEMYGWTGNIWKNMTDIIALQVALTQHRQNLFANEKHLSDAEKYAVQGTSGTPSDTNRFVTDADTRIPTQNENNALVGSHGAPSSTNKYVTQALVFAQPSFINGPAGSGSLAIPLAQGPVFLGRGGAGTHIQYFKLFNQTLAREYVQTDTSFVDIAGVYKDAGLTQLITDPSSESLSVVDSDGFYIGGTLYVKYSATPDTNYKLIYNKKSTLGTYKLDMLNDLPPQVAQINRDLLRKFEEVTGRKYDDPTLSRETNKALAEELGDVKQYINANSATDFVVTQFDKMNGIPGYEGRFIPNIGMMNYKYENTSLIGFSYNSTTGVVTYSGSPDLSTVLANHVFIDGSLNEFVVTAVGLTTVTIRRRDATIPVGINTTVTDSRHGSVKVDNNPRKVNLATLGVTQYRDRVPVARLALLNDEYHPATGQVAFEIIDPLKSVIHRENRFRAYGNWQTRIIENSLSGPNNGPKTQVYSVNKSRIMITGFFTDLELICDYKTVSGNTLTVITDGISTSTISLLSTDVSFDTFDEVKQKNLPIINNLADNVIHTVEVIIPNDTNEFVLYGFDLIRRNYSIMSIASGRAFVQGDIVYKDTVSNMSIDVIPPLERGGVTNVYYNRDLQLTKSFEQRTTFDGTVGAPGGTATVGASSLPVTLGTTRFNQYFKAGDVVKVATALAEEVKYINSTASNTATFSNTLGISGVASLIHLCSTTGETLDAEVEARKVYAETTGLATVTEFGASPPLTVDRMVVQEDGVTKFIGQQISFVQTGVEGYGYGIKFPNASSRLRIVACCTRMDIIAATPTNIAFQYTVSGSPVISKSTSVDGFTRITLLSNGRFQAYEVDIFNATNLIIAAVVFHEPEATNPIVGTRLAELKTLARYQATNPNASSIIPAENYPLGSICFDAYSSFVRFSDGLTPWFSSIDFSKLYGRYTYTNGGGSYFEYDFYGDAFEVEYTATPDSGYALVRLNLIVARSSNISAVYKGMNASTGVVDMYSSVPTRRRFSISGLPYNRYTLRVEVPLPYQKNAASSDYYINVNQVFFVNSNGYFGYANQLAKSSIYYMGYSNAYDRRSFGNGTNSFDDLIAVVGQAYNLSLNPTAEVAEIDGGTF